MTAWCWVLESPGLWELGGQQTQDTVDITSPLETLMWTQKPRPNHVFFFPIAAVINYHNLSGINNSNVLCYSQRGLKSLSQKSRCQQSYAPFSNDTCIPWFRPIPHLHSQQDAIFQSLSSYSPAATGASVVELEPRPPIHPSTHTHLDQPG